MRCAYCTPLWYIFDEGCLYIKLVTLKKKKDVLRYQSRPFGDDDELARGGIWQFDRTGNMADRVGFSWDARR